MNISVERRVIRKTLVVASTLLALAACASGPGEKSVQRKQSFETAAGQPVRSFHVYTPLYSWEALNDTQLVVYPKPREAFLLDLAGPCSDLTYATGMTLTSNMSTVYVNFDKVIPIGGGVSMNMPCVIKQIRPVDVSKLKAIEHEQRKVDVQERKAEG